MRTPQTSVADAVRGAYDFNLPTGPDQISVNLGKYASSILPPYSQRDTSVPRRDEDPAQSFASFLKYSNTRGPTADIRPIGVAGSSLPSPLSPVYGPTTDGRSYMSRRSESF